MPRPKHYFPVSHDINSDPEIWELTDTFGGWLLRVWLEILSIADRNEGEIKGELSSIARVMGRLYGSNSRRYNSEWRTNRVVMAVEWMQDKGWIRIERNKLIVCNYSKYHRWSEPKQIPSGNSVSSPPIQSNPNQSKPNQKNNSPPSQEAFALARLLDESIGSNFPARIAATSAQIHRWADDIDRLHRIDGKDFGLIEEVLRFSQSDDFWRGNIQSGGTFRRQWNQLIAKMNGRKTSAADEVRRKTQAALNWRPPDEKQ